MNEGAELMDTINELAADERTARIILAIASEPGDTVTGRMIRTVGASETVARAVAAEVPVGPDGDTWQRRLAPRIDATQTERVIADGASWNAGADPRRCLTGRPGSTRSEIVRRSRSGPKVTPRS
jgi:hypothetical protein